MRRVRAARRQRLRNDLDTVTALDVFDSLAIDLELPGGCKFETAAHLDRLFGLDLAADVGKY